MKKLNSANPWPQLTRFSKNLKLDGPSTQDKWNWMVNKPRPAPLFSKDLFQHSHTQKASTTDGVLWTTSVLTLGHQIFSSERSCKYFTCQLPPHRQLNSIHHCTSHPCRGDSFVEWKSEGATPIMPSSLSFPLSPKKHVSHLYKSFFPKVERKNAPTGL